MVMQNPPAERYACAAPRNYHEGLAPTAAPLARQLLPYRQLVLAAALSPKKVALVVDELTLTFAELSTLVERMASGLAALGVRRGEAVAVLVGNHWRQLPLWLAVARLGAVFMAASRYLSPGEILFQLDEARPRLVIGELGVSIDEVLAAASDAEVAPFADEDAGVALRFSSGTTGRPKMMIASHRAHAWQFEVYAREMGINDRDTHLCVGPLAHAALHFALAQLLVGGVVVMKEAFEKEALWRDCEAHGVTNTMVVPTMITSALDFPGEAPGLRAVTSLGAPLTPALKRRLLERFPNLGLFDMYGSAELGMATCLRPAEQLLKPASAGRACLGAEVAIFDDEGQPVPVGEVGNIYARGIMQAEAVVGSVQPAPAPPHLVQAGWISCGDLGRFDEDGYLYISDRRVDLILSGGLNVYPAEVELAMCEVRGVVNVAVVGLPDERWGQAVTAYVEGAAREEALMTACREKLARYKWPRAIHFVDALPRTPSGKISRKLVRDAVAERRLPS